MGGVAQLTASLRRDENAGSKYRLVILANARQQLNDYSVNLGEAKGHLQNNLIYAHTGEWEARLGGGSFTPLPMWGETDVIDGMTVPMTIAEAVSLMRSLARVDVVADAVVADFDLTRVHVYHSKIRGLIIPDLDNIVNEEPSLPADLDVSDNN